MLEPDIIIDLKWYHQVIKRRDANRLDIYMSKDATEHQIDLVKQAMKQLKERHPVMNYSDFIEVKGKLEEYSKSMKEMAYSIVIIFSLIGLMGVANTLLTSIYRQESEIAMFRVGGMTYQQVISMVLWESLQYGFQTLIYAIPIGAITASWFLYNLAQKILLFTLIRQIVIASLILLSLCILFSIPAIFHISKREMIVSIKEESG